MTIAHPNALAGTTREEAPSLTGVHLDADPFHLVPYIFLADNRVCPFHQARHASTDVIGMEVAESLAPLRDSVTNIRSTSVEWQDGMGKGRTPQDSNINIPANRLSGKRRQCPVFIHVTAQV